MDVICNRFDFTEVREEVHAMGMVSHHPDQKVCLYISDLFQKKKEAGWLKKCLCKYLTEISRFVLDILENSKVIANVLLEKCVEPLENPKAKKEEP